MSWIPLISFFRLCKDFSGREVSRARRGWAWRGLAGRGGAWRGLARLGKVMFYFSKGTK